MDNFTVLNYQGNKTNLINFISSNMKPYIKEGKAIFDIFSGSCSLGDYYRKTNLVYANDSEIYASVIADAILNKPQISSIESFINNFGYRYKQNEKEISNLIQEILEKEYSFIRESNIVSLKELYESIPTVWNEKYSSLINDFLTVENSRKSGKYILFLSYFSGSYFGISQALEIDSIIKTIKELDCKYHNALFSCLFFAMKETCFSKDGHMAQPLNLEKNAKKAIIFRSKNVFSIFIKKLEEYAILPFSKYNGKNIVLNNDFENILESEVFENVGLVYADPPYTDMQYSRYYHLLNIAVNYDFPKLTKSKKGYTKGLYTEGRFQSKLSSKKFAKEQMEKLIKHCFTKKINLAISFAYPRDLNKQASDRYTMSIDELISICSKYFEKEKIEIKKIEYTHSNHRNHEHKKVNEFLILCGEKRSNHKNIENIKKRLNNSNPTKNSPVYNSHMYWSQKSYNVCDILIEEFSKENDIVFDPFMGSGVTVLESILDRYNRCSIGCDINDVPLFIVDTIIKLKDSNFDENVIKDIVLKLSKLNQYYVTKCEMCGNDGIISKVVFDKPERKNNNSIKIKTINYHCECTKKGIKTPNSKDYEMLNMKNQYKHVTLCNLIQNSKIAVVENDSIENIFTPRALSLLDEILEIISKYDSNTQIILKYVLLSIIHLTKITDKHSNSQWPLWIPKIDCIEKNIVNTYIKKLKQFSKTIEFVKENYSKSKKVYSFKELSGSNYLLLKKGCQHINEEDIPDESVDLIITDPPYLEQVLYSEYMQLYKPFFNLDFNLDDEIIVSSSPERKKTKNDYFHLLDQAFQMCSKKLKKGKYMCLYFHDSSLNVWNDLISILEKNNFLFVSQIHIDKTNTLKNIISPKKSLNGDSILFFTKNDTPVIHAASESIEEIEENILRQAKFMVKNYGPLSTPELYDNGLMEILIQNGWLKTFSIKYKTLVDLFEKHFIWDSTISKWKSS